MCKYLIEALFCLDVYPELGHMEVLCLFFKEIVILFFTA